jgi:hypothetical protein
LPPLRPAAFFCAVVPPCEDEERDDDDPDFFPPRLEAPDELEILAARSFDIPLSFNASYCFSFFTLARLPGNPHSFLDGDLLGASIPDATAGKPRGDTRDP